MSTTALRKAARHESSANFRALVFDVDGTLADTEELHRQAFNEAFFSCGVQWRWGPALSPSS